MRVGIILSRTTNKVMHRIGFLFLLLSRGASLVLLGLAGYHVYEAKTTGGPMLPADIHGPESSMAFLFGIVFFGLFIAWFKERMGGWIVILGLTGIYVSEYLWSNVIPYNEFYIVIACTGLLFILSSGMIGGFAN